MCDVPVNDVAVGAVAVGDFAVPVSAVAVGVVALRSAAMYLGCGAIVSFVALNAVASDSVVVVI